MKTPNEIREKLDEFRDKRLIKDKAMRQAIALGDLGESSDFFEAMVTLEGGIEALKWVLGKIKILED